MFFSRKTICIQMFCNNHQVSAAWKQYVWRFVTKDNSRMPKLQFCHSPILRNIFFFPQRNDVWIMTAHFKRGKFASGCRNSLTARLPGKRIMTNEEKRGKKNPENRSYFKSARPSQEMSWAATWKGSSSVRLFWKSGVLLILSDSRETWLHYRKR